MKLPSAAPAEESANKNPEVIFPSSRAEHRRNGRRQVLSLFEAFRHRREAEFERAPPVSRRAGRSGAQGAVSFGYFSLGEQRKVSMKKKGL
jgi:hypothetical protein